MDLALEKKAHVFRLPTYLLDRLKELAAKDRRSLNNYVEGMLLDAVYHEPNEITKAAFEEAKAGKLEESMHKINGIIHRQRSIGITLQRH